MGLQMAKKAESFNKKNLSARELVKDVKKIKEKLRNFSLYNVKFVQTFCFL